MTDGKGSFCWSFCTARPDTQWLADLIRIKSECYLMRGAYVDGGRHMVASLTGTMSTNYKEALGQCSYSVSRPKYCQMLEKTEVVAHRWARWAH